MPGKNIATAPTTATRNVSNTGSHVLAIQSVIIALMMATTFHSARLTGPIRRRSS